MQEMSYTTDEIAKLLKVSKLTVYDLIKKGELTAYRVGKQMRIDASDLEDYKQRTKSGHRTAAAFAPPIPAAAQAAASAAPAVVRADPFVSSGLGSFDVAHLGSISSDSADPMRQSSADASRTHPSPSRPLVITGQDISLDILAKHLEGNSSGARPLRSYIGSLDGLISLYRGESDIVSTHLIDGDTGEYNLPYIRKLLVGLPCLVINLLSRQAGLYVQRDNPHQIRSWADLSKPGLRLVNREIGSGARVLLDEQLRLHRIAPAGLDGYHRIENNHISIAGTVASGEADVGIGIEKAAAIVGAVDFIPLIQERYDLVMLKKPDNEAWRDTAVGIIRSENYQNELRAISGYDLSLTGQILFES